MRRELGGYQDQVEPRLTRQILQRNLDGEGEYTLVEVAREEAGFEPMETYIL